MHIQQGEVHDTGWVNAAWRLSISSLQFWITLGCRLRNVHKKHMMPAAVISFGGSCVRGQRVFCRACTCRQRVNEQGVHTANVGMQVHMVRQTRAADSRFGRNSHRIHAAKRCCNNQSCMSRTCCPKPIRCRSQVVVASVHTLHVYILSMLASANGKVWLAACPLKKKHVPQSLNQTKQTGIQHRHANAKH